MLCPGALGVDTSTRGWISRLENDNVLHCVGETWPLCQTELGLNPNPTAY